MSWFLVPGYLFLAGNQFLNKVSVTIGKPMIPDTFIFLLVIDFYSFGFGIVLQVLI